MDSHPDTDDIIEIPESPAPPVDGRQWDVALMQLVLADAQERLEEVVAELSQVPAQVQSRQDAERVARLAEEVRSIAQKIPQTANAVALEAPPHAR